MSDLTIEFTDKLIVITCWCGMNHAVPEGLRDYQLRQHRDGRQVMSIYCPLGHAHSPAGEGEAAKLRKRLAAEERRRTATLAELDQARASLSATKGQVTKLKRRVTNGVCPHCHRTFAQLARHMKTKHPDCIEGPTT